MEPSPFLAPSIGWTTLAVISTLWIVLGILWSKKSRTYEQFTVAGRNVGLALGAATVVATWVTSNTTLLAPQFAIQMGIWGMLAYSTAAFGLFVFAPLAGRIQVLMPRGLTSGDFIRLRYGQRTWNLFLLISFFYALTWLVSMAMAGGLLMETLAGIPYHLGMSVIVFTCVAYTLFGGMYAVIGTDFIQSVVILIGLVIVAVFALGKIDVQTMHSSVSANRPELLSVLFPAALMSVCNNLLFGFGEIFHSNVWWSRAFALRPGLGRKAYTLAGLIWLPIPITAGFIALSGDALGIVVGRPDIIGPVMAAELFGTLGAALVFVIVFCSLASSLDSLLAATSDLIVRDIIAKRLGLTKDEKTLRRLAAWAVLALGVATWAICLPRIGTLAEVLFFAGPLVSSTIWPIVAGLYWPKADSRGAFLGMFLGSTAGLTAYFVIGWFTASLIGAAVSMFVVVVSTRFSSRSFQWTKLNEQFKEVVA